MTERVKVEILRTFNYSDDGINAIELVAGTAAEIGTEAAAGLISEGYVKLAPTQKAMNVPPENKALGEAPENKAEAAPERTPRRKSS